MIGTWSSHHHEAIARLVASRTGFTYALTHPRKTESGIQRAMRRRSTRSVEQYLALLQQEEGALDELMDELTIRETYFFREPRQYEFLRRQVLPELRRSRAAGRPVRAWSAGCASGEEAYSLAILLKEEGFDEPSRVLGTDISQAALTRARSARFRDWSLRGMGPAFLARYFRAVGSDWELTDPVRNRVAFAFQNLALDAYPSHVSGTCGMDVILCRNVLIYFDDWTVDQVARRLRDCLNPGGWVVTASTDPALGKGVGLEPHVTKFGVFYRRPVEAAVEPLAHPVTAPAPVPPTRRRPPRRVEALTKPSPSDRRAEALAALKSGAYARVLELIPDIGDDEEACLLRVDALVNHEGPAAAEDVAKRALHVHPLSAALHFRHAVLLSGLGRLDEAEDALRRVIYVDRGLAVAHFVLGSLHWRRHRVDAARRCYATAARIARGCPSDEELPLADGQTAGALARAATGHLEALGGPEAIPA